MLIALNHHVVGDIIGGAFVGWAIGGTAARWFGLDNPSSTDGSAQDEGLPAAA